MNRRSFLNSVGCAIASVLTGVLQLSRKSDVLSLDTHGWDGSQSQDERDVYRVLGDVQCACERLNVDLVGDWVKFDLSEFGDGDTICIENTNSTTRILRKPHGGNWRLVHVMKPGHYLSVGYDYTEKDIKMARETKEVGRAY